MPRKKTCHAAKTVCVDAFYDLSAGAQALYFLLGFEADNDGFVDGIKSCLRKINRTEDELCELTDAGYVFPLNNGYVIRNWWVDNNRNARDYREGLHIEEVRPLLADYNSPYRMPDGDTRDVQGMSDGHPPIKESNVTRGERESKPNQDEANQDEKEKRGAAPSTLTAPCPVCREECAATEEPDGIIRSWCRDHGDFYMDESGRCFDEEGTQL